MHAGPAFLQNLALVLCVAAAATIVFQRLRQPVVFGYLLAGMIVGPYLPIPLAVDEPTIRSLAELGVVLLMFGLGLEFNLKRLFQVGGTAGLIALGETSVLLWVGVVIGTLLGWGGLASVYLGAAIAFSSTTIIAKAFEEQHARGRFTGLVLGVLIMEDLVAIFLLAVLTAVSSGGGVSVGSLGATAIRLATFLIGLVGIGLLVVPRTMRLVVRMNRPETTLIAAIGIAFGAALLALFFGYSVALGAFIAGSLVAESGEERAVEPLVKPVRDIFVAVFFVAVGMTIDPAMIGRHWLLILVLSATVVLGKVFAVTVSSFLTGAGPRTAIQSGMSMGQIGEFSFIIAGMGLATGTAPRELYAIVVGVSAITTLATPWLIWSSDVTAAFVDRKLPHAIQTYVSLYGTWIATVRARRGGAPERSRVRRLVRLVLLDAIALAVVVIGASLEMERLVELLVSWAALRAPVAHVVVIAGWLILGVPLLLGLLRTVRMLGLELAMRAMPAVSEGAVDIAAAPRRALVVTLQLAIVFAIGLPLLAITEPFLPPFRLAVVLAFLLVGLGIGFWRSATNLQGHARAGAEVVAAALASQMASDKEADHLQDAMEHIYTIVPGLGEPVPLRVPDGSTVAGRTLAQVNLRGLTGATVLAILRDGEQVVVPAGKEELRAGDVLAVAGTAESVEAARELVASRHDASVSVATRVIARGWP